VAADESPPLILADKARRDRLRQEEALRLLYVAMTRARCWLIVAGAGKAVVETGAGTKPVAKDPLGWCWYRHVEAGMRAVGALPMAEGRLRLASGDWPAMGAVQTLATAADPALPDWVLTPAAIAPHAALPLSPSDLGGAKVLPGDMQPGTEADAKARGTALHLLLERLPALPPHQWPLHAAHLISDLALRADVLAEAEQVLRDPALQHLFAADALTEVAITCDLGPRRLVGSIDRLLVGPETVLAIDYKSNRLIPASPAETPESLLRQMGAYLHALGLIYPHHRIDTAILWTRAPLLMPLPRDIVRDALARATIP
jgi:ATP-dependent helicase/nuclease subunit A